MIGPISTAMFPDVFVPTMSHLGPMDRAIVAQTLQWFVKCGHVHPTVCWNPQELCLPLRLIPSQLVITLETKASKSGRGNLSIRQKYQF